MWLWHDIDHFAFHLGHREGGHEPFRNEAQFAKAAEDLAQLASTRIAGYRGQFPDVTSAARHLAAQPLRRGYPWDGFDAGIAAALSGDATGARRLLEHFLSQETGTPASPGLRSAQEVYDLADDTPGVHAWALAKVSSCRTKLRLDPYVDSEVFGRAGGDASIG
ncbi:hypothetical protein [Streptomyces sp. NPDC048560]|uniref:hypothetical protein n=1 Tax=Streptomyces sp. NPDC048560 TaxID=3155488 RepID=UPI00342FA9BF